MTSHLSGFLLTLLVLPVISGSVQINDCVFTLHSHAYNITSFLDSNEAHKVNPLISTYCGKDVTTQCAEYDDIVNCILYGIMKVSPTSTDADNTANKPSNTETVSEGETTPTTSTTESTESTTHPTKTTTSLSTVKATTKPGPPAPSGCIVVLLGTHYDASGFVHPGGTQIVSRCGTDISSACESHHGKDDCTEMAKKYLKVTTKTSKSSMVTETITATLKSTKAGQPASSPCIVTVNGAVFDAGGYVHPGGNQIASACGTDITAACNAHHGQAKCTHHAMTFLKAATTAKSTATTSESQVPMDESSSTDNMDNMSMAPTDNDASKSSTDSDTANSSTGKDTAKSSTDKDTSKSSADDGTGKSEDSSNTQEQSEQAENTPTISESTTTTTTSSQSNSNSQTLETCANWILLFFLPILTLYCRTNFT